MFKGNINYTKDILSEVNYKLSKNKYNRHKYKNYHKYITFIKNKSPPTYPFIYHHNITDNTTVSGIDYPIVNISNSKVASNYNGILNILSYLKEKLFKSIISKDELTTFIAIYTIYRDTIKNTTSIDTKHVISKKKPDTRPIQVFSNTPYKINKCDEINKLQIPFGEKKKKCREHIDICKYNNKERLCQLIDSDTSSTTDSLSKIRIIPKSHNISSKIIRPARMSPPMETSNYRNSSNNREDSFRVSNNREDSFRVSNRDFPVLSNNQTNLKPNRYWGSKDLLSVKEYIPDSMKSSKVPTTNSYQTREDDYSISDSSHDLWNGYREHIEDGYQEHIEDDLEDVDDGYPEHIEDGYQEHIEDGYQEHIEDGYPEHIEDGLEDVDEDGLVPDSWEEYIDRY